MRNRHLLFNSGSNEVRLVVETQYRAAWQVGHLVRRFSAAENGQSSAQSFDDHFDALLRTYRRQAGIMRAIHGPMHEPD